jgi:hypothetical protein
VWLAGADGGLGLSGCEGQHFYSPASSMLPALLAFE